jgi:hypothetical protein
MGNALKILLRQSEVDEEADGVAVPSPLVPQAPSNSTAGSVVDLLTAAPHSVPYVLRVELFRELLALEKKSNGWSEGVSRRQRSLPVRVNRGQVLEDALVQLLPLGRRIKAPLAVTYIDEHGLQEAGASLRK